MAAFPFPNCDKHCRRLVLRSRSSKPDNCSPSSMLTVKSIARWTISNISVFFFRKRSVFMLEWMNVQIVFTVWFLFRSNRFRRIRRSSRWYVFQEVHSSRNSRSLSTIRSEWGWLHRSSRTEGNPRQTRTEFLQRRSQLMIRREIRSPSPFRFSAWLLKLIEIEMEKSPLKVD